MNIIECQKPGCRFRSIESCFINGVCPICKGHDLKAVGEAGEVTKECDKQNGHFRSDIHRERA